MSIPGGYAEYVALPARNLVAIPDDLAFPEASVIANAIGTPYHALTKQMRLRRGSSSWSLEPGAVSGSMPCSWPP